MTTTKFELRGYQKAAVHAGMHYLKTYDSPFVIQAATGAGKSLIIADLCHKLDEPVLVLQPSKELLEQNYAKLERYGVEDIAMYSASKRRKEIGKFTYATIGSIYKRPDEFKHFKKVIIDECHLVNPKGWGMYKSFLDTIKCRNVCGLTATPYRIVQKYVTHNDELFYTASLRVINRIHPFFFRKIVYKIETQELIEQGYLAPIKYIAGRVDMDALVVNSTGADFTEDSLQAWGRSRVDEIAATTEWSAQHAKRTLVFCTSLAQAILIQTRLRGRGIDASFVSGQTPVKEREEAVRAFKSGEKPIMLNVGVFTTGFDVPELNSIILARPTMSLALYYQMVGRGVRLDPADTTKVLRVIDLAGMVQTMGRVETVRLGKEADGFRDTIESERGRMDEKALFTFKIKKETAYHGN